MVRSTNQEMTAIEKTICFTDAKRRGHPLSQGQSHREALDWSGGRELGENMSKSLDCGFHRKEWVRQVSRFRISQSE